MEPLDPRTIKRLLTLPESATLDFKREPYALKKGKEFARAELIKDVLAFANTPRDDDAFILLGVAERPDATPEVIGVTEHLDGAEIQQIVNTKTNRPVNFRYEKVSYENVELGVIRIERVQARPLYLRHDYEHVRKNTVYVRQDSTTAEMSPDEVLQMKRVPVAMLREGTPHPAVRQIAERWLAIFEDHDVRKSQIATILGHPELCAGHFQSWETLLPILTDDLMDHACRLFNIDRAWLDGDSEMPFDSVLLDRRLCGVLRAMVQMRLRSDETWVIGLKSHRQELQDRPNQLVGVLLRSDVIILNNRAIECYMPILTGPHCSWADLRFRWDLKRIFLAARHLGMSFIGCTLPARRIVELSEGKLFPGPALRDGRGPSWHPDDFIYAPNESGVAKEPEELQALLATCKKSGFLDQLREVRKSIPSIHGDAPEVPNRP